jgi:hypothetical protein
MIYKAFTGYMAMVGHLAENDLVVGDFWIYVANGYQQDLRQLPEMKIVERSTADPYFFMQSMKED